MSSLQELGEFGLIKRFRRLIKTDPSVIKGSGDDCAVIRLDKNNYQLITCDMLVEGVDFTLKDNPYLIGRKSISVSLSDIAACCGMAKYCVISLGIPVKTPVKLVDKIFKGMNDLAREFKFNIVGGDISRAPKIIIDVSMVGIVKKKHLALRSSACKGDIIFVTGSLGGSIKGKHLNFTPRIKEARFLAENFRVAAMIDISDGLLADLSHILEESNVGGVIYEELIPVSDKASGFQDALTSGEDFELLFTLPRREALRLLRRRVVNFKPIGEILDMKYGFKLINKDYKLINLSSKGYRHF